MHRIAAQADLVGALEGWAGLAGQHSDPQNHPTLGILHEIQFLSPEGAGPFTETASALASFLDMGAFALCLAVSNR